MIINRYAMAKLIAHLLGTIEKLNYKSLGTDVKFTDGENSLYAHSYILNSVDYFNVMIKRKHDKAKNDGMIEFVVDDLEVMRLIITYIYSDKMDISKLNFTQFLTLINKLDEYFCGIPKDICEPLVRYIRFNMKMLTADNVDNILSHFAFSEEHIIDIITVFIKNDLKNNNESNNMLLSDENIVNTSFFKKLLDYPNSCDIYISICFILKKYEHLQYVKFVDQCFFDCVDNYYNINDDYMSPHQYSVLTASYNEYYKSIMPIYGIAPENVHNGDMIFESLFPLKLHCALEIGKIVTQDATEKNKFSMTTWSSITPNTLIMLREYVFAIKAISDETIGVVDKTFPFANYDVVLSQVIADKQSRLVECDKVLFENFAIMPNELIFTCVEIQ